MENRMATIPLNDGLFAHVDDEYVERLSQYYWFAREFHGTTYAFANIGRGRGRRQIRMHRLVLQAPNGVEVDHRNGDGLNNRRKNLRFSTHQQNQWNKKGTGGTSKYKGVSFCSQTNRWKASIRVDGRTRTLGRFDSEEQAARAYDAVALKTRGEWAHLNFQEGG
jgi:hypothetical protein